MKSVCVFCGHQTGNDPVFRRAAREMGEALAREGLRLVPLLPPDLRLLSLLPPDLLAAEAGGAACRRCRS